MMAEARKTTMGHITQEHLLQSRVVLPPNDLILQLDKVIKPLQDKKVLNEVQIQNLTDFQHTLLPMFVNGQIKIKHN
jgi:type I restriction enzyme S subunit